uniref:tumor necrosis factor alpha-induced protein 8 isoform X2 n=1 Tax=Myxine glutinosa TaxID=7769 RepID=UPI00358F73B7
MTHLLAQFIVLELLPRQQPHSEKGSIVTRSRGIPKKTGLLATCSPEMAGTTENFSSKSLALKAQKKILSGMASRGAANLVVDDVTGSVLDELYRLLRGHLNSRKEAEKVIKDIIKIVVKVGVLSLHNQFSTEEMAVARRFKTLFHQLAMTVVTFYRVEFTFDRTVLMKHLETCKGLLHKLIENHLSAKSHGRVDHVFGRLSDAGFLTAVYTPDSPLCPALSRLCDGLDKLLDDDVI